MELLSEDEGRIVFSLVKKTIGSILGPEPEYGELPPIYEEQTGGVLITRAEGRITENIPALDWIQEPHNVSSLKVGLIEAAKRVPSTVGVSFFPELFDQTRLEITIMSVPKALECSPKERPENIVIGREGLIIKDCGIIVYFLPWVAVEKNLSPEDFLDEACKLGVGRPKMWMEHSTEAMTFQVQTITG